MLDFDNIDFLDSLAEVCDYVVSSKLSSCNKKLRVAMARHREKHIKAYRDAYLPRIGFSERRSILFVRPAHAQVPETRMFVQALALWMLHTQPACVEMLRSNLTAEQYVAIFNILAKSARSFPMFIEMSSSAVSDCAPMRAHPSVQGGWIQFNTASQLIHNNPHIQLQSCNCRDCKRRIMGPPEDNSQLGKRMKAAAEAAAAAAAAAAATP